MAEEVGCRVRKVEPIYTEKDKERLWEFDRMERISGDPFPEDWLIHHVENEKEAYLEEEVKAVVTGFNIPCTLSARSAGLPLIFVMPGTFIPPYFEAGHATFPETFENPVIKAVVNLVPEFLGERIVNWLILGMDFKLGVFNSVAEEFGVEPFERTIDITKGDHNLVSDSLEFLRVKPSEEYPRENFVGPFPPLSLSAGSEEIQREVNNHLKGAEKSIYLSMGASGRRDVFLKALEALGETDHNVVASYTSILEEENLPNVSDNVLLVKYVHSVEETCQAADLVIIHGGENTVHTVSYSGKPIIGIPMQIEQQFNLDALVQHGTGIRLSKYPDKKDLLEAVGKIFGNYRKYLKKAQQLAEKLPNPEGDKNAAERLLEITNSGA